MPTHNRLEHCLSLIEQGLRTLYSDIPACQRPNPADNASAAPLSGHERRQAVRLLRVHHATEIASQGLYHGQAVTVRRARIRRNMARNLREEGDHLGWTQQRLRQLHARPSLSNPLWYGSAFIIGALSAKAGEQWSLGCIEAHEHHLEKQLEQQLQQLPANDHASRAVLEQIKTEARRHGQSAWQAGATALPWPLRQVLIPAARRLMQRIASWI